MKKRRPIDAHRESAFSMEIKDKDDQSDLKRMIGIGGSMYIFKDRSIWSVKLADEIDPNRSNPSIPNVKQKFLDVGLDSEFVRCTIIQADELLKQIPESATVKKEDILAIALAVVKEFAKLNELADDLHRAEESAKIELENSNNSNGLKLAEYKALDGEWRSALSAMDEIRKSIRKMAFIFYPEQSMGPKWFDDLRRNLTKSFAKDSDGFNKYSDWIDEVLKLVRWMRNHYAEHPKPDQFVTVLNFELQPHGIVYPPMVRFVGRTENEEKYSMASLISQLETDLLRCFETIFVWLCLANIGKVANSSYLVIQRDNEDAKIKQVGNFSYGLDLGGTIREISY